MPEFLQDGIVTAVAVAAVVTVGRRLFDAVRPGQSAPACGACAAGVAEAAPSLEHRAPSTEHLSTAMAPALQRVRPCCALFRYR